MNDIHDYLKSAEKYALDLRLSALRGNALKAALDAAKKEQEEARRQYDEILDGCPFGQLSKAKIRKLVDDRINLLVESGLVETPDVAGYVAEVPVSETETPARRRGRPRKKQARQETPAQASEPPPDAPAATTSPEVRTDGPATPGADNGGDGTVASGEGDGGDRCLDASGGPGESASDAPREHPPESGAGGASDEASATSGEQQEAADEGGDEDGDILEQVASQLDGTDDNASSEQEKSPSLSSVKIPDFLK